MAKWESTKGKERKKKEQASVNERIGVKKERGRSRDGAENISEKEK